MARLQLAPLVVLLALMGTASANYIGFADTCTNQRGTCTGKTMSLKLDSSYKSCAGISVACFTDSLCSGYLLGDYDDGYKGACPSCSVDSGGNVWLYCSVYGGNNPGCPDPISYTGICGDPHFSGPGGIHFNWHGVRDQDFSLISDTDLQVNAHFVGERTNTENIEHGTWIQEVSLGYKDGQNTHFLSVGIDEDKDFESKDVFYFTFNGEDIPVGSGSAEYSWTSPDGLASVVREAHQRAEARVRIEGLFEAVFYPRVESRIQLDPLGKYLDMDMKSLNLTRHSHGVLGQMFRPDAVERKNAGTQDADAGHEFLIEGRTEDYRVSSLQSYDSLFNQFNLAAGVSVQSVTFVDDVKASRKLMVASGLPTEAAALGSFSTSCSQESGSLLCK